MKKKKILIAGGTGMLGHKLIQVFGDLGFDVYATTRGSEKALEKYGLLDAERVFSGVDVDDFQNFEDVLRHLRPDAVINSVGVIKQLPEAEDFDVTLGINSIFPQRTARVAEKYAFKFINISTDCVFSGKKGNYIEEDISDAEDLYGKSKFLGEVAGRNCLTLRTSIIGRELQTSHSLLEWFLSRDGHHVRGYTNAVYTGFPTRTLGEIIAGIIENQPGLEGVYHVSSDPISKYDLLVLIREKFGLDIEIEPFADFYMDRSLDSSKFRKITGFKPSSWDEMIRKMAADQTPYEKWRQQKY